MPFLLRPNKNVYRQIFQVYSETIYGRMLGITDKLSNNNLFFQILLAGYEQYEKYIIVYILTQKLKLFEVFLIIY